MQTLVRQVAYNGLVSFGKKDKGKKLKLKKDRMQILPFHSDIGVNSKDGGKDISSHTIVTSQVIRNFQAST